MIHFVSKKICQNSIKNVLISETNNQVKLRFGKSSYCKQLLERHTHTHTHTQFVDDWDDLDESRN